MNVSYMWSMRTFVWLLVAVLFCRLEFSKSSRTDAMARHGDLNVVHDCIQHQHNLCACCWRLFGYCLAGWSSASHLGQMPWHAGTISMTMLCLTRCWKRPRGSSAKQPKKRRRSRLSGPAGARAECRMVCRGRLLHGRNVVQQSWGCSGYVCVCSGSVNSVWCWLCRACLCGRSVLW